MIKVFLRCLGKNVFRIKSGFYAEYEQPNNTAGLDSGVTEMDPVPEVDLGTGNSDTLLSTLGDIQRYLGVCVRREMAPRVRSHRELVVAEWQLVAVVIDRTMFWLSLLITVVVAIVYVHVQY